MDIEIKGLQALMKKLDYLGEDSKALVNKGLELGAKKVQGDAKKTVAHDTGKLKGSISVEKISNGFAIGTNVNYAPYIEYGTGTKGDPKVEHTQRDSWVYMDAQGAFHTAVAQSARPFLQPALERNREYITKSVRNVLARALKAKMSGGTT